jgi:DNA invertase Pin-like site-specific DNA recombinase
LPASPALARLAALGVPDDRIYLDKGLTGTSRARPGLDQALAAVRSGDTLVVPKLDRLARSVPDARHIGDSLVARGIKLSLGGTIYDPADPLGKMFFNILATFAEFEVDLLRLRTREGMAVARAKGKLKGKQPKLTARQQAELTRMHATGDYTIADLMEGVRVASGKFWSDIADQGLCAFGGRTLIAATTDLSDPDNDLPYKAGAPMQLGAPERASCGPYWPIRLPTARLTGLLTSVSQIVPGTPSMANPYRVSFGTSVTLNGMSQR